MLKIKISKTAGTVLKIILSSAALVYVFSKIDLKQVLQITGNSNALLLLAALLFFILSKIIASLRLNRFFRAIDIYMTEIRNLKLYLLGMFYNLFLPGGIGGDGYKIYLLNKRFQIKTKKIFWSVLFDRVSGIIALFALAMLLAGFINLPLPFNHTVLSWLLIPISFLSFFILLKLFFPYLKKTFLSVSLLSLVVQLLQTACAFMILLAMGGSEKETEYLFLFLLSSIVAMLPFTIGGAGARELTFLFGSGMLHLDENTSVTLSLVFYFITLFTSFWGIIFSLTVERENKMQA